MANARYQLKQDVYMKLDGQWRIVQSGTVFDDNIAVGYAPAHVTTLSPGEPAVALDAHGSAKPIRLMRFK